MFSKPLTALVKTMLLLVFSFKFTESSETSYNYEKNFQSQDKFKLQKLDKSAPRRAFFSGISSNPNQNPSSFSPVQLARSISLDPTLNQLKRNVWDESLFQPLGYDLDSFHLEEASRNEGTVGFSGTFVETSDVKFPTWEMKLLNEFEKFQIFVFKSASIVLLALILLLIYNGIFIHIFA